MGCWHTWTSCNRDPKKSATAGIRLFGPNELEENEASFPPTPNTNSRWTLIKSYLRNLRKTPTVSHLQKDEIGFVKKKRKNLFKTQTYNLLPRHFAKRQCCSHSWSWGENVNHADENTRFICFGFALVLPTWKLAWLHSCSEAEPSMIVESRGTGQPDTIKGDVEVCVSSKMTKPVDQRYSIGSQTAGAFEFAFVWREPAISVG